MRLLLSVLFCYVFFTTLAFAQGVSDKDLSTKPTTVKSFITGKTIRTYGGQLQNTVEYFAPNGKVYLWSSRRRMAIGTWRICSEEVKKINKKTMAAQSIKVASICRTFPTGNGKSVPFNTVWATSYKPLMQEHAKGDIFGLANRKKEPFVLGVRSDKFSYILNRAKM